MRSNPGNYLLFAGIFLATVILACSFMGVGQTVPSPGAIPELAWLAQTRAAIIDACREENVNVSLNNGHVLGVEFVNSGFNSLRSAEEKRFRAREVARLAKSRCPYIDQIDTIYVSFIAHPKYSDRQLTARSDTFEFKKTELEADAL